MRTTLTAVSALALLAMATPASAADVYSAKDPIVGGSAGPANWTGFYLGVNGGYGENASSRDSTGTQDSSAFYTWGYGTPITSISTAPIKGADPAGFLFGGQVGYLYQPAGTNFVLGGEFAFDGSSITGDRTASSNGTYNYSIPAFGISGSAATQANTMMHQELDYVATLTGTVGVTLGQAMVYTKAGLAFGQVQESITVANALYNGNNLMMSRTATDTGWTAGAGAAWKFTPNWSIFIEGDYFDLGSHSVSYVDNTPATFYGPGTPGIQNSTSKINEDFWLIKAGVNYQVGNVYQSLK